MMKFNSIRLAGLRSNGREFQIIETGLSTKGQFLDSPTMYESQFISTVDISGQLIIDTVNGNPYLADKFRFEQGIYRGPVYLAQGLVSISRYPESVRDSFNRSTESELTLVTQNIPVHFHHGSTSIEHTPDRSASDCKRTALLQTSSGIEKLDVLTTQHGTFFKVLDIENFSYGLSKLFLVELA